MRWEVPGVRCRKARMHSVHPGSHPLSSSGWLELLPGWLEFLPGWLESVLNPVQVEKSWEIPQLFSTQSRLRKVEKFFNFSQPSPG